MGKPKKPGNRKKPTSSKKPTTQSPTATDNNIPDEVVVQEDEETAGLADDKQQHHDDDEDDKILTSYFSENPRALLKKIEARTQKVEESKKAQPNNSNNNILPLSGGPIQEFPNYHQHQNLNRPKIRKLLKRLDDPQKQQHVRDFLNSTDLNGSNRYQLFRYDDLEKYADGSKELSPIMREALYSVGDSFYFWECCSCYERFDGPDSLIAHVEAAHCTDFKASAPVMPQCADEKWVDEFLDAQNWVPEAALEVFDEMPEREFRLIKPSTLYDDEEERTQLLEKIRGFLRSLMEKECLSIRHMNVIIGHAMKDIQGSTLLLGGRSGPCGFTRFVGVSQLEKILGYIQSLWNVYNKDSSKIIDLSIEESKVEKRWDFVFRTQKTMVIDFKLLCELFGHETSNADVIVKWIYMYPPHAGVTCIPVDVWEEQRLNRRKMAREILSSLEQEITYMCKFHESLSKFKLTDMDDTFSNVKIMKYLNNIKKLTCKLVHTCFLDYLPVLLSTIQTFLRGTLERLAKGFAEEAADNACKALLAELENDDKSGQAPKKAKGKPKGKKKSNAAKKSEGTKADDRGEEPLLQKTVELYSKEEKEDHGLKSDGVEVEDNLEEPLEDDRQVAEVAAQTRDAGLSLDNDSLDDQNSSDSCRSVVGNLDSDSDKDPMDVGYPSEGAAERILHTNDTLDEKHAGHSYSSESKSQVEATQAWDAGLLSEKKEEEDHEPQDSDYDIFDARLLANEDSEDDLQSRYARYFREIRIRYGNQKDGALPKTEFLNLDTNSISILKEVNVCERGLRNEVCDNNGFMNVIIQSLWHLRRFRSEFMDVGNHLSQLARTLYEFFVLLGKSCEESVDPFIMRIRLREWNPDKFKWGQMEDASEVLSEILNNLHQSYKSSSSSKIESRDQVENSKCDRNTCIVHKLFGMDMCDEWICNHCKMENAQLKYTEFVHYITAAKLRDMKKLYADSSLGELWRKVDVEERVCEGCGELKHFCRRLSTIPPVFISVLTINGNENAEEISDTLEVITTEVDIASYGGIDVESIHRLVSMVCYLNKHYICFSRNPHYGLWVKYEDRFIEVTGSWDDVVTYCKKALYHPTILFFELSE